MCMTYVDIVEKAVYHMVSSFAIKGSTIHSYVQLLRFGRLRMNPPLRLWT